MDLGGGFLEKIANPEKYDLIASACHLDEPCYSVRVEIREDLSKLMPFLNAEANVLLYEPDEDPVMIFKLENYRVALRRHELSIGPVSDRLAGRESLSKVIGFLNEIWHGRHDMEPNFEPRRRPPALEIFKLLPGTNCGECGEAACMAFAVKIALGRLAPSLCPQLQKDLASMRRLHALMGLKMPDDY